MRGTEEEEKKFQKEGLTIKPHVQRMSAIDENGKDIEDNFKDPKHPLQLVFVCAMWLTGFDAPSISTLYLDKPMKGHTLMQTIARANRVFENKECGLIIDHINVFKHLKRALADYASNDNIDMPVKNIDDLFGKVYVTGSNADNSRKNLYEVISSSTFTGKSMKDKFCLIIEICS